MSDIEIARSTKLEKIVKIAEKYGIKNIKQWKDKNLFKYLLDKAKSSETPFPILCDFTYNSEIGFRN